MTEAERREWGEFVRVLTEDLGARPIDGGNSVEDIALELSKLARTLDRYNELRCEIELTERQEKRETRTEEKVNEIGRQLGCKVLHGGDPRGFAVKLLLPSGRHNSWGGPENGWGVPI